MRSVFLLSSRWHIQGYSKRSIHFQKFILQKILTLNPCPVYGWKGNLSKFWYRWSEPAHHWGCGCCYLWHAATSVGRAGLTILHLPRHTWDSHRVLVRCENNFESSPFSLYIARRHMFSSTCKIIFWVYTSFWITLYISTAEDGQVVTHMTGIRIKFRPAWDTTAPLVA
jgi:hypothetical protein